MSTKKVINKDDVKNIRELVWVAADMSYRISADDRKIANSRIFDEGNPALSWHYMTTVPGANLLLHKILIEKSKDPLYSYYVAKTFSYYPLSTTVIYENKETEEVSKNKNYYTSDEFLPGENYLSDDDFIITISESEAGEDAYSDLLIDADIAFANNEKLERNVIEYGNPQLWYLYSLNVPGANIDAFRDLVMSSGDEHYINEFKKNIDSRDNTNTHKTLEKINEVRRTKRCMH